MTNLLVVDQIRGYLQGDLVMPFCPKPLGAALSIAAIAAVTMTSSGSAQQAPGSEQQAAPEMTPPQGQAHAARPRSAVVSAKVNLRSGRGTDSDIVATIPAGSMVGVAECDGEWCAVTWNGQSGYAIARNLSMGAPPYRQAGAYPAQPGQPGYPDDGYDLPGYAPGYYGPPVVYGPAYYYGPRVYYYGPGWGWRRRWW